MKNSEDKQRELREQQWFNKHMGEQLQQFDSAYEPDVPGISEFEALVTSHKREMVRKQWRDLLLFWLIALPVLGMMLWVLERNLLWFVGIQSAVSIIAVFYVIAKLRKKGEMQWNKY